MAPLEMTDHGSHLDGANEQSFDANGERTVMDLKQAAMDAESAAERLRREVSANAKVLQNASHPNCPLSVWRRSSELAAPFNERVGNANGNSRNVMSDKSSSTRSLRALDALNNGSSRSNPGSFMSRSTAQAANSNIIDDLSGFDIPHAPPSVGTGRSASATDTGRHGVQARPSISQVKPPPRKRGRPPRSSYPLMSQPVVLHPRPSNTAPPQSASTSFASSATRSFTSFTSAASQQPTIEAPRSCDLCRQRHRKCSGAETNIWPCDLCRLSRRECVIDSHERSRPGPKARSTAKSGRKPGRKPGGTLSCEACRQRKHRCSAVEDRVWPCVECKQRQTECVPWNPAEQRGPGAGRALHAVELSSESDDEGEDFDEDLSENESPPNASIPNGTAQSGRRNPGRGTKEAIGNYYAERADFGLQERSTSRSSGTIEAKVDSFGRRQQHRGAAYERKRKTEAQETDRLPHYLTTSPASSFGRLLQLRESDCDARLNGRGVHQRLQGAIEENGLRKWRQLEGASKDIIVAEWSPNGRNYAVSTSTELDSTSRPYNKEKNFLWGDVQDDTLRELDDHHVLKARGETLGDRAVSASQQTSSIVDERLFTTVSSVCFSSSGKRMYSGSYDCTVKIWSASPRRSAIKCKQTLRHEGRVELLSISHTAPVQVLATAQSTQSQAISVYDVSEGSSNSMAPVRQFSHEREIKDALYPSALRWGILPSTKHLLLAGFAENNVDPWAEDRQGNLCLWDVEQGAPFIHLSPSSQNVFDVCWHPTLPVLAAGTSPGGPLAARRRQAKSVVKTFEPMKGPRRVYEFDCPALDINEIQFHPLDWQYVCAACTDGRIYVWDARRPDDILQVLEHGPGIEPLDEQQTTEQVDTGVRFMAWSSNGAHLYTGSSDGVVKCWNPFVAEEDKHVRDVATFDSAVMSGAFSPDYTHLLIGLCKGAVHVLSSAPWSANQEDNSDGPSAVEDSDLLEIEELMASTGKEVPEIQYLPPVRSKASEAAKRHREAEQVAQSGELCKDLRTILESSAHPKKQRRENKVLVSERGGGYKLYDGWDGPSTEEDSDLVFERGVSEKELSELCDSEFERTHKDSRSGQSATQNDIRKKHEKPVITNSSAAESSSHREVFLAKRSAIGKIPVRERTPTTTELPVGLERTEASTPTKTEETHTPTKTASAARRDGASAMPRSLYDSPHKPSRPAPDGWRPIRVAPPPRAYLQKQRHSVQEQASRAKAQGNMVVLDDD